MLHKKQAINYILITETFCIFTRMFIAIISMILL